MRKAIIIAMATAALAQATWAEEIEIKKWKYSGPISEPTTAQIGLDWPWQDRGLIDLYVAPQAMTETFETGQPAEAGLHVLQANIDVRKYTNAELIVDGIADYQAMLNGEKLSGAVKLRPASYTLEVRFVANGDKTPNIKLKADKEGAIQIIEDGTRMMSLPDVLYGTRISGASISPSGRYIIENTTDTDAKGEKRTAHSLYDLKSRSLRGRALPEASKWMPTTDRLYAVRTDHEHQRHMVVIDPATGAEEILFDHLPEGDLTVAPTEDFLIFNLIREGKKKDTEAYYIIEPDDRQPGWRDRSYPAIYRDGKLTPLTSGADNVSLCGIDPAGQFALIMTSHTAFGTTEPGKPVKRPTTLFSLHKISLADGTLETVVTDDGFLSQAALSPDGKKALVMGTPEAFGRIGCVLPESVTPSMTQQELFIVDLATKEVTPITRDFDPNPVDIAWSKHDGNIYLRAEKRDVYAIYRIDPNTGKISELPLPENIIKGFSLSDNSPAMAIWGQSDSNSDRLYNYDTKVLKPTLLHDPSATRMANVRTAKCIDYNFTNSKGDTIYGRYYLPDNFDPDKKYPLIVNYYGGCSPTQRGFETRYPWHVYAQHGYVVYVLNPSGATGFGQEFSSRHVSTAGKGVADDIIEGTKQFVADHPYVDGSKIGCIGASYGGFMTMYLQTVTDLFAAAISHAGISDHTSYWGEGYWGYSYSEVSMGNDLPWTNPDLYVKQSPLYRADKVSTPILFLHGDADTNVPPGESIQMYTALKLLGQDTALIEVSDQNHHILDPAKRQKWQDAIMAWFAKYLQDDPDWWNSIKD